MAGDASAAARAIELCTPTQGSATSLLSAALVRANGGASITSRQIGLVANFGPNVAPRAGERMLALSSGSARPAAAPDACGAVSCNGSGPGTAPPGFPQDVPGCSGAQQIHDDIGLEVELRAPSAAQAYAFDFTFYSHEYPEFVCSAYNDQFIALASPAPEGSIGGNISFDDKNNPVSINIAFFEVCQGCPQGTQALVGTGFDTWGEGLGDAGATGWLTTKAPILGGELVTLRFTIWDTGDTELDSTVLVDNFRWLASTVEMGTIPAPK